MTWLLVARPRVLHYACGAGPGLIDIVSETLALVSGSVYGISLLLQQFIA